MNNGSRLANETPGQARSMLARRAAQRVRDAAATLRRDDVAVSEANGGGAVERSHRFTIMSGRVDRESVKGTFGLSLSWRNAARRQRGAPADGPLAVMRLHVDLHVPRFGRDVSCHRAFFFGSVPEAVARGARTPAPAPVVDEPEHRVIDLRAPHDDMLPAHDRPASRAGLFADNPVVEHERQPVPTREPAPVHVLPLAAAPVVEHERAPVVRPEPAPAPVAEREPEPVAVTEPAPEAGDEAADPEGPLPEGWHPDPVGHAELRYWDGRRWTAHISTGGRLWLSPVDAVRPGTRPITD